MFDLFKDNKPEIHKKIKQAIQEEEYWFNEILVDVRNKIANNEDFDLYQYCWNADSERTKVRFNNPMLQVHGASSREMFQSVNKISPDAKYDVDTNSVVATVKGMKIFLMHHSRFGPTFVSVYAMKYDSLEIINVIKKYIEESC